jgi:hypothetical protein
MELQCLTIYNDRETILFLRFQGIPKKVYIVSAGAYTSVKK